MKDDIKLGAFVALHDQAGRLLMLHREDMNYWCLPGGLVEVGESLSQAAIRECYEEIGVRVELSRLLGIYSDPATQMFRFSNGSRTHYFTAVFVGAIISGFPSLGSAEVREIGYFLPDDLPSVVPSHKQWVIDAFGPIDLQRIQ